MRMSLMFAAVTLLTGINLFFIPFQPVPALWGAILAVAFVLINVVADKLRLWSGIAWIIVAGIIITLMLKGKEPGDELRGLITVFAFLGTTFVKMMGAVIFLIPLIQSERTETNLDIATFFVPYFLFLLFETIFAVRLINNRAST